MKFEKFLDWLKANFKEFKKVTTLGGNKKFDAKICDDGNYLLIGYGKTGNGYLSQNKIKIVWDKFIKLGDRKVVSSEYTDPNWTNTPDRYLAPYVAALIRDFENKLKSH